MPGISWSLKVVVPERGTVTWTRQCWQYFDGYPPFTIGVADSQTNRMSAAVHKTESASALLSGFASAICMSSLFNIRGNIHCRFDIVMHLRKMLDEHLDDVVRSRCARWLLMEIYKH